PAKVGQARTQSEQRLSGVMVGRSAKVTGDEPGSGRQLTGSQYMNPTPEIGRGPAPAKVRSFSTLRGSAVTGNEVGCSAKVTGDEPGACKNVTGDDYVGRQQYDAFCQGRPAPEAAKVGLSTTNRNQTVSGTSTGRSPLVTGDEPGTCKAVTGTPYAGLEQAGNFCSEPEQTTIVARTPTGPGTPGQPMTGLQPGIGGVMTGAERGACEPVSGTPYVGADQFQSACGQGDGDGVPADLPQPLEGAPWTRFTVSSPFRAAHTEQKRRLATGVTGTLYERGGTRITGPFGMAGGRVTGTEEFRFDQRGANVSLPSRNPLQPLAARATASSGNASPAPVTPAAPSRVTGEGMVQGVRISGDDWSRNDRVTGTEGPSSRRRNPSRPGPMSAMHAFQLKRNAETEVPLSPITGSSGNTDKGAVVTFSGGARG
ncbi:MAG: carboxysome shell protein, partial [Synechococcus sp. SB0669_bin_8]|nr:carboxysome shell protein [Synechococcus sp. SB0669_bin_8]